MTEMIQEPQQTAVAEGSWPRFRSRLSSRPKERQRRRHSHRGSACRDGVVILDDQRCVDMMRTFQEHNPDLWVEDIAEDVSAR
jgi:hypothetical protein